MLADHAKPRALLRLLNAAPVWCFTDADVLAAMMQHLSNDVPENDGPGALSWLIQLNQL